MTTVVDSRLSAIGARATRARASTDEAVVQLAVDLAYLLDRLKAAEATIQAAKDYATATEPFLQESFTRVVIEEPRQRFGAVYAEWDWAKQERPV